MKSSPPERLIFWGGTGQCIVMENVANLTGMKVAAIFDDTEGRVSPFAHIPLLKGEQFEKWLSSQEDKNFGFAVTIGNPNSESRINISERLIRAGLTPVSLIHPSAIIASSAQIGEGCQIHAGAIIEARVQIGKYCIVNTKASIDHECVLEDGVEIAPGATLCGSIKVRKHAWICAGATILPWIEIGEKTIVGAQAVVLKNLKEKIKVAGIPAKIIKESL